MKNVDKKKRKKKKKSKKQDVTMAIQYQAVKTHLPL